MCTSGVRWARFVGVHAACASYIQSQLLLRAAEQITKYDAASLCDKPWPDSHRYSFICSKHVPNFRTREHVVTCMPANTGNEEGGSQWQANVGNSNPFAALRTPQPLSSQSVDTLPKVQAGELP